MLQSPTEQVSKKWYSSFSIAVFPWGQCGVSHLSPLELYFTNTVLKISSFIHFVKCFISWWQFFFFLAVKIKPDAMTWFSDLGLLYRKEQYLAKSIMSKQNNNNKKEISSSCPEIHFCLSDCILKIVEATGQILCSSILYLQLPIYITTSFCVQIISPLSENPTQTEPLKMHWPRPLSKREDCGWHLKDQVQRRQHISEVGPTLWWKHRPSPVLLLLHFLPSILF